MYENGRTNTLLKVKVITSSLLPRQRSLTFLTDFLRRRGQDHQAPQRQWEERASHGCDRVCHGQWKDIQNRKRLHRQATPEPTQDWYDCRLQIPRVHKEYGSEVRLRSAPAYWTLTACSARFPTYVGEAIDKTEPKDAIPRDGGGDDAA